MISYTRQAWLFRVSLADNCLAASIVDRLGLWSLFQLNLLHHLDADGVTPDLLFVEALWRPEKTVALVVGKIRVLLAIT